MCIPVTYLVNQSKHPIYIQISMAPQKLQYIIKSAHPTGPDSTSIQRKTARSHAARAAHAKERRQRTLQYQAQKRREEGIQTTRDETDTEPQSALHLTTPKVITLLPASRRDPFMSYARKLRPIEEILFDHCTYIGFVPSS